MEPQPVGQQVQPTPKPSLLLPLILSIIVIFLLCSTAYLAYQNMQLQQQIQTMRNSPSQTPRPVPTPIPTGNLNPTGWRTYNSEKFSFKYPSDWIEKTKQTGGSSWWIEISDPANIYTLTVTERSNFNNATGKPFTSIRELSGFPYDVPHTNVGGQEAARVLPRAGSEMNNMVVFFSTDPTVVYNIELDTPRDGSKTEEGVKLFNQILSSFEFKGQTLSSTCQYNGKTYKNGESVPSGDTCNTCTCANGQTQCTLIACN